MAPILHAHPLSSYCWKVLIALYEKGIAFDYRMLDFSDSEQAAAFRDLWPIAKMPVLVDGGRTIVESSIIIEHLDMMSDGAARLIPADAAAALPVRALDRIFDHYVMTPMQQVVGDRLRPAEARDPYGVEQALALLDTACAWLEQELKGRSWAAGDFFSLADCAAAPSLHYADRVRPFRGRLPVLTAYLDHLEARPSFARVLSEAAPYRHMFPQ